jgi:hypothetical protein
MSAISLEASLRTCKVDTGYAANIDSQRFLNPNYMVCPIWNGMDTAGRSVCPDSFYTKNAGCNSALDRVVVENAVSRPQYAEYIGLNVQGGLNGNIYGDTAPYQESVYRRQDLDNALKNITGHFSSRFQGEIYPTCGRNAYQAGMAQEAAAMRKAQSSQIGYEGYNKRKMAGFAK